MEPYRIIVDRFVYENKMKVFDKDEKHMMWKILSQKVRIDNALQTVDNAMKIYAYSVFDAINDGDPSKILHYGKCE